MTDDDFRALYTAFNARDADGVLAHFAEDVRWPRAWEGDHVTGTDAVRDYWRNQWSEIEPTVEPTAIATRPDGRVDVTVHQVVRDKAGAVLADGEVHHVYTLSGDRVGRMDIEGL